MININNILKSEKAFRCVHEISDGVKFSKKIKILLDGDDSKQSPGGLKRFALIRTLVKATSYYW